VGLRQRAQAEARKPLLENVVGSSGEHVGAALGIDGTSH
jgi:hypothetical protein